MVNQETIIMSSWQLIKFSLKTKDRGAGGTISVHQKLSLIYYVPRESDYKS